MRLQKLFRRLQREVHSPEHQVIFFILAVFFYIFRDFFYICRDFFLFAASFFYICRSFFISSVGGLQSRASGHLGFGRDFPFLEPLLSGL